jgi:hypothetical protein
MLSYLFLAYEGNYVSKDVHGYEWWTYNGQLYMVDPHADVILLM